MQWLSTNWTDILKYFGVTVEMSILAGLIALVVGTILAAMRVGPVPLGRVVGGLYIRLVRNTPLLVVMLIFAFGLPELNFRPSLPLASWFGSESHYELIYFNFFWTSATIALGLYTASFVCEAIRSGINAVPLGQAEAARAIGMTFAQSLRLVVLPQAFRVVVPPLASTYIAMVKNTSVAFGVGVAEAAFEMHKLSNDFSSQVLPIFIVFAIGYMILVAIVSAVSSLIERKLAVS